MKLFYLIFPLFNIAIAVMMILIGFKKYVPSSKISYYKHCTIFKTGGVLLLAYGLMTFALEMSRIV